jgi:hypothetical protein
MNPFDRPLAGSYKNVLVEALRNVGNNIEPVPKRKYRNLQLFPYYEIIFIPTIN